MYAYELLLIHVIRHFGDAKRREQYTHIGAWINMIICHCFSMYILPGIYHMLCCVYTAKPVWRDRQPGWSLQADGRWSHVRQI